MACVIEVAYSSQVVHVILVTYMIQVVHVIPVAHVSKAHFNKLLASSQTFWLAYTDVRVSGWLIIAKYQACKLAWDVN